MGLFNFLKRDNKKRSFMSIDNSPKICQKTLIGVLASHDAQRTNSRLISIFNYIYKKYKIKEDKNFPFHFVFTGGTHDRLFFGAPKLSLSPLNEEVAKWLVEECGVTRLNTTNEGGVIQLTYLICQRKCNIVWTLFAPNADHWLRSENLALTRLSDQWHAKRLMNVGSVITWYKTEFDLDVNRNVQKCPPKLSIETCLGHIEKKDLVDLTINYNNRPIEPIVFKEDVEQLVLHNFIEDVERSALHKYIEDGKKPVELKTIEKGFDELTIALIAHDDMKTRMVDFAIDHENELDKFKTILATGTTGREVAAATSRSIGDKMIRHHSGPKGGDIEIATAILYRHCHVVIFFIDPLSPHPHIDDIRVVFQACMVSETVVMITNEMHAREFMTRTVRGNHSLLLCNPLRPNQ